MKQLLIIAHCPSANTIALVERLKLSAQKEPRLNCVVCSPFEVDSTALKQADGVVLFTPENFGYMSGALKDMFDRCYYDIIDDKRGLPYALVVRAGNDGTGARRATESIIQGLGWTKVQDALILKGEFRKDFNQQIEALGEGFATALAEGMI